MLTDTIVAPASAPGSSERAVIRVSGPRALAVAAQVFSPPLPSVRATVEGAVTVRGMPVPAFALVMVAPRSFTGEDVVELHVPGGALLVQEVVLGLLHDGEAKGVRAALPGEFTARAVRNGRLHGGEAEGLLMLLHAADQRAAALAMQWLRGGAVASVVAVRNELQDALALLEAGLDFTEGETGEVAAATWREPLLGLHTRLVHLVGQLPAATPGGEVLLLGRANAGKSSLANALAGREVALVDAVAGTTRDLLRVELPDGGVLWDAPGDLELPSEWDAAALRLRERLAGAAMALLLVLDAQDARLPTLATTTVAPWLAVVWTKCEARTPPALPAEVVTALPAGLPVFATSSHLGSGIPELRSWLARTARAGVVDAGAPLRVALATATAAVARAIELEAGPEVRAIELQTALRAIDGIAGEHSPEHLLDRIYSRFCLGK